MKAVCFDNPGTPDVMKISNCEIPKINDEQVLIEVKYAGVNRPDVIQREGNYPAPPNHSKILGLEVSGYVYKIGANVERFKKGDKVAALVNGGGYAEFCSSDEETTFKIPQNVSLKEAATIPECFFTVWSNLIMRGKLREKQKVLVHGGTSGIGVAAIQILQLYKSEIFTTVGTNKKKEFCESLGVQNVFNYKETDFYNEIKKIEKKGIDIVLDYIGGDYINKNINLLKSDGKLINIGFLNGSQVNINLMKIMLRRLTITGSTLRIREKTYKGKILNDLKKIVFPNFENGKIKCYIDSVFKLKDVVSSHKYLEAGGHIGKIVLEI